MNTGVIPADKELRKKFIIFLVLVTIAFIAFKPHIKGYMDQIDQLSKKNPELAYKKTMLLLKWSMGVVFILLLSMGVYLSLLARRTLRSGQYPPPGMRVIRDTRLRTGNQAKRAAISLIVLASILIVVAFFFLYWPYAFEKTLLKKKGSNEKINLIVKKGGKSYEGVKDSFVCNGFFHSDVYPGLGSRKCRKGKDSF